MRRLVPQESKRRLMDSCVCNILMYLIAVALAIGSVAFCATRTHMYHMAFSKRQQQVHNDLAAAAVQVGRVLQQHEAPLHAVR